MKLCRITIIFTVLINSGIVLAQFWECEKSEDCIASNAECVNNLCECPIGTTFSNNGSTCLEIGFSHDFHCVEDQQCAWLLGDNVCDDGKCRCANGWVYYMGQCITQSSPKQSCSTNKKCFNGYDLLAMVCKNDVCECNKDYYLRGNTDCRPISANGEYCSLNSDCQPNNVCQNSICREAQSRSNETVINHIIKPVELLNTLNIDDVSCKSNDDCTVPNSICNLHFEKCLCKRGYRYVDEEDGKCVEELGTYNGCTKDDDCQFKYSRCVDGTCYCRKSYFTLEGNIACQKPMTHDNLFCNNNERCYVLGKEGVCVNNKCQCSTSDPPNSDYVCESTSCETTAECTNVYHSICLNNVCQCPENYHKEDSMCLPDLGSSCSDTLPCNIANATCRNSVCSCNDNFIANDKSCFQLAPSINSTCEIQEQCSGISNSECINNICRCSLNYFDIDGKCLFKKNMDDACRTTSECRTFLGTNVVCRNGYCGCPVEMVTNEKRDDCVSSSNILAVAYSMTTLLVVFNLFK